MTQRMKWQPAQPALQAALRPIHENAPCRKKLTYLSSRLATLQKRLLVAFNDVLCMLMPLDVPAIHNCKLSINTRDREVVTSVEGIEQSLHYCLSEKQKWVEKRKMTIFSLFNLKNKRTWIEQDVNRRFLALALGKSGIDILLNPCYLVAVPAASLLSACRLAIPIEIGWGAEQRKREVFQ